jgi:2',3'-cyclic-nucleotide 2'-phosphodiesterase (5'-nucleotidase family)
VTVVVSSGDNLIPGPRWFAAENSAIRAITGSNEPGHVDHAFMNAFGVVASALGNHDLDQGPGEFAGAISSESSGGKTFLGTLFPYLAANVDFSRETELKIGTDGADYASLGAQVAASATVTVGGETIGLVGVSTPALPSITSTGRLGIKGTLDPISGLAAEVQPAIDALRAKGIDKIIVLAHLQEIVYEKALARELKGVDIIVAGGSNTRMGDSNDTLYTGDTRFAEAYPFQTTNKDNEPLLIVNVDADYKYLGRLVVSFDENGVVLPTLLDDQVNGAYAAIAANVTASGGEPIADVVALRDAIDGVIVKQYDNVIGHTDVYLEGRRGNVRREETNLGNLTADSIKWYAQECDEVRNVLTIKNGGGIRAEIGDVVVIGSETTLRPPSNFGLPTAKEGDISEGHLRGTLRFDNGLVVVDVTGKELKMLLEHGVAGTGPGLTPGQFPQIAGISFGYDPAGTAQVLTLGTGDIVTGIATPGTRVTDLYVDTNGDFVVDKALYIDGVEQAAATGTYAVATLNFLANGGDRYPFALLSAPNRRQIYTGVGVGDPDAGGDGKPDFTVLTNCDPGLQTTFSSTGGEQDALAEYFLAFHPDPSKAFKIAETPPADDRRIQDLAVISDFVEPTLPGIPLVVTGVIDGPLTGGTPKAVELYVAEDISDLSTCGISSANNGGGPTGAPEFLFTGSAVKGEYLYFATETPNFTTFFGFAPDWTDSVVAAINGDDAIELFCDGAVIDVFGEVSVDGSGQPWEYTDGWAYRKSATGPDASVFTLANWSFSGIDALDGATSNATARSPFPVATYKP